MLYFSLNYSLLKGVLVLPYKFFMTHANLYLCLAYLAELRWGGGGGRTGQLFFHMGARGE